MSETWTRPAALGRLAAGLLALGLAANSAGAWGPEAHRAVHGRAISALPKPLRSFFSAHRGEMATFSELSLAEEGTERRFAIDRLATFPFLDLPANEAAFRERYGSPAGEVGRLPWLAQASYEDLVVAFRSRRQADILREADLLASLLADLSNPLALTDNHDGQRSEQHGLWTRVSVRLPEALGRRLTLKTDVAHLVHDPRTHLMSLVRGSYVWADNILYEEDLAARSSGGHGALYFDALAERLRDVVEERLSAAARDVASYWYTAWVTAGKPELESLD